MKQYPGYTLVKREDCPEQHGTLTVLTHDVSGAAVLLVENDDDNKAFGIGFGTFPSDDTGVFHILEHSVLAGSEKYPVKSPFLQLLKSSMASFLNAMTFPDKTVYPFATPNETDFKNLMDVYLNAVFCPLAMVDKGVFEQEGWHRDEDGTVSGVVYNEMQGALATPDAQLQNALSRAMFPDTAYGFVSGGDPASIPALTYEKYVRVYRRHYSADNCCITLYGKMDMAEKLAFLDEQYLSCMPKSASRPRLTVQDEQVGAKRNIPYYTEKPEPDEAQCALAWYTGAFSDRERQLGVEILLDALLGTNQAPLKAALLEEKLGADIDVGFDDSTLQPTLELVLRGATEESAGKFAAAVRKAVDGILEKGIPEELLMASLNSTEFASLERPGSIPDGVLDAINASTGWLHTGDPALLLHTNALFASLREKLEQGWFNELLRELFAPAPVEIIQVPTLPKKEEEGRAARTDGKLVLDHPLTAADLGEGKKQTPGSKELLAGAELLHHPSAGNTYLYLYYDLGGMVPEDMSCLHLLTDVMDELDTEKHTAQELNTLRNTWLGSSGAWMDCWTGRQEGRPCHAKLIVGMSMLERSLEKAVELGSEWLYEAKFSGPQAEAAMERVASQQKLLMEQKFLREGHAFAAMRAAAHFSVESALSERCNGVSYYHYLCELLEKADWTALGKKMEELWKSVLKKNALTVSLHGSDAALDTLKKLLPGSAFAAEKRGEAKPYTEELTAPVNEAFIIDGGVNYDVLVWPMERRLERKVLARVMSYEYLWHNIREVGGAYGTGMVTQNDDTEYLYTYRDPHLKESYETFAKGPAELAGRDYTEKDMNEFIVGAAAKLDTPRKPREEAASTDCKYFCGITDEVTAAERKSLCSVDAAALKAEAADLSARMEKGVRVVFGSKEAVEAAKELFDRVETL
ncbi:insulinase family protein [Faecalibacterium prausnitzii]|uniref:insulinase family protein n=1 Tax=Faecalibacterium prausnitzii TaxID=853 RepID=UPI001C265DCB|nr:insulinase family protein [Faecalibacterium prausnitzii]MBU8990381.1 insulinase family protein [Faecalibacterium prausnitzii]MCQ5157092.1 insulinase family protein [Faecalibacterium prausnitzii]